MRYHTEHAMPASHTLRPSRYAKSKSKVEREPIEAIADLLDWNDLIDLHRSINHVYPINLKNLAIAMVRTGFIRLKDFHDWIDQKSC